MKEPWKKYSLETTIVGEKFIDFDKCKIELFCSSIHFMDKSYVSLTWNNDKLKSMPSNHQVLLSVLNHVSKRLTEQGLYDYYCRVFLDQEKEGIIERIISSRSDFGNYIWIPH